MYKTNLENKNIFLLIRYAYKMLGAKRKRQIKFLLFIIFISSICEIISITLLLPFLSLFVDPQRIYNFEIIKKISHFFNIYNANELIMPITIIFIIAIFISGLVRLLFNYLTLGIASSIGSDLSILSFFPLLSQPF